MPSSLVSSTLSSVEPAIWSFTRRCCSASAGPSVTVSITARAIPTINLCLSLISSPSCVAACRRFAKVLRTRRQNPYPVQRQEERGEGQSRQLPHFARNASKPPLKNSHLLLTSASQAVVTEENYATFAP